MQRNADEHHRPAGGKHVRVKACPGPAPECEPVRERKSGKTKRLRLASLVVAAFAAPLALAASVSSQQPAAGAQASAAGGPHRIAIVLARELRETPAPLSLLDLPPADDGVAGARLAINDNTTTGRFLQQEFTLEVVQSADASTPAAATTACASRIAGRTSCTRRPRAPCSPTPWRNIWSGSAGRAGS
jgi:hypothetical protein